MLYGYLWLPVIKAVIVLVGVYKVTLLLIKLPSKILVPPATNPPQHHLVKLHSKPFHPMAVITRSKAKQARIRRLPTGPSSRSLRRTTTRVIICASATGEGVHTRWLRSKRTSESPAVEDSGRYVTPAPTAIQIPGAPLKVKGPNPNPPGTPPMFVLKPMEGIEEEGEHVCNTGSSMLGSPFSSSPPTDRMLERQVTLPNSAFEGAGGLDEGGAAGRRLKRRAYGANGTHLIDSEGNDIWV